MIRVGMQDNRKACPPQGKISESVDETSYGKSSSNCTEYVLVDKDTNEILKFGETLYPETRYSKSYLEQNNAVMKVLESGVRNTYIIGNMI